MNRKNSNYLLFLLIIFYTIIYRFLICSKFLKYEESITSVFFIVLFFISYLLLGFRKTSNTNGNKKTLRITLLCIFLYFIIIYSAGLILGFLSNSYSRNLISIFNNSIFVAISIIFSELARYIFISSNRDNKKIIYIYTFLYIILFSTMLIKIDTFSNIGSIFVFLTLTILPVSLKNMICSYLTYHTDFKSSLVYRLIMELYVFVVPLEPDLSDYLKSITSLLLPFLIYILTSRLYRKRNIEEEKKAIITKKTDIPFIIFILVFFCIITGIGPLKMLGIKTGSMTPNINVGDAVIIYKYVNMDSLKENEIIAYKKGDEIIVHRIIKINSDKTYITKGDFNNTADSKYISRDEIYGKVILRIPYIAYPAVKLSEK